MQSTQPLSTNYGNLFTLGQEVHSAASGQRPQIHSNMNSSALIGDVSEVLAP